MSRDTQRRKAGVGQAPRPGVSALAAQALAIVRLPSEPDPAAASPEIVDDLRRMVLASPAMTPDDIVAEMRAHGLSDAVIVDDFIPAVARTLGDCWLSDELPFAQVSIGAARLQGLLPLLEDGAADGATGTRGVGLLLVAESEHHTLGALVLAHQLRRQGLDIHVTVGAASEDVLALVQQGGIDVVMISCSQPSSLDSIAALVDKLRKSCAQLPPILLGGAIAVGADEVVRKTGVDLVLTGYKDVLPLIEELAAKQAGRA